MSQGTDWDPIIDLDFKSFNLENYELQYSSDSARIQNNESV